MVQAVRSLVPHAGGACSLRATATFAWLCVFAVLPSSRSERTVFPCRCIHGYDSLQNSWSMQQHSVHFQGKLDTGLATAVEARVNHQFRSTPPYTAHIDGSGVCVHLIDPDDFFNWDGTNAARWTPEAHPTVGLNQWWLACNPNAKPSPTSCPRADSLEMQHRGCSVVNIDHPTVWGDGEKGDAVGYVMSHSTRIACAYPQDGASSNAPNAGIACKPRSANKFKPSYWAVSDALKLATPGMHNEIVIHGENFLFGLPWIVEAFVIINCSSPLGQKMQRQCDSGNSDFRKLLRRVTRMRTDFVRAFPWVEAGVPILVYNGTSFAQVDQDGLHKGARPSTAPSVPKKIGMLQNLIRTIW